MASHIAVDVSLLRVKKLNMKDKFLCNKKRKHYSYIFKVANGYCLNILLTTESSSKQKKHKKYLIIKNIKLFKHPNKNSAVEVFIYNYPPYRNSQNSFDVKTLNWVWDINDKRKVKRMKRYYKYYGNKKSR